MKCRLYNYDNYRITANDICIAQKNKKRKQNTANNGAIAPLAFDDPDYVLLYASEN